MAAYRLVVIEQAVEELDGLDGSLRKQIAPKIFWIAKNALKTEHEAMEGDEWKGVFKWQVAKDWRLLYRLNHEQHELIVIRIGHRSSVYNTPPPS